MEVDFFSYLMIDYHLRGKVHVTLDSALSVLTHAQVCIISFRLPHCLMAVLTAHVTVLCSAGLGA